MSRCTYSFSRSRRGTWSHHGGVAAWLYPYYPVKKVRAINTAVVAPPSTDTCPTGAIAANYTYDTNNFMASATDALSALIYTV